MSPAFAEMLGLLCAEGSHIISYSSYWGKDKGKPRYFKNDKSERIEFTNLNLQLLTKFQNLLATEFGYSANINRNHKVTICKTALMKRIIHETELGCVKWRVPTTILLGKDELKVAFLRGYFDGDGTISNRVRFFSSNKAGITQVSKLLNQLNISHTIQGPICRHNRKPAFVIQVSQLEKEKFLNLVKPTSKRPDSCEGSD